MNDTRRSAEPVLWQLLAQASHPLPLSELAKHSRCVRSNMTQLVDRLEARGLVRRVSDGRDRRIRRVALTAPGAEPAPRACAS